MRHGLFLTGLLAAFALHAQDAGVFEPPKPYDVKRYEGGWNKNPFTLKTAPVAVENAPFARDLTVGTYYGDVADPTIVIVNTKTNERFVLKKSKPASNGMTLKDVKFGSSRKDLAAEVTLGSETSEIRYNDSYVKQMAAAEGTQAPVGQPQGRPGVPGKIPMPQIPMPQQPGAPARVGMPGAQPATAHVSPSAIPGTQGMVTQNRSGFVPGGVGVNAASNPSISLGGATAPLVSQAPNSGVPNMPVRRRLVAPVANDSAIPQ